MVFAPKKFCTLIDRAVLYSAHEHSNITQKKSKTGRINNHAFGAQAYQIRFSRNSCLMVRKILQHLIICDLLPENAINVKLSSLI